MFRSITGFSLAALAALALVVSAAQPVSAKYPTNDCVSKKQKAAGKFCQDVAKAWSKYLKSPDKDPGGSDRDGKISDAADKLSSTWQKEEGKAADDGAACSETTATAETISGDIAAAMAAVQSALTGSLSSSDKDDQKCGSKLVKSAGKLCASLLKAESKRIKDVSKDLDGSARDGSQTDAGTKFGSDYDKSAGKCTGTPGAKVDAVNAVQAISDDAYTATTTSPTLPGVFTAITYTETAKVDYNGESLNPRCIEGTPYSFFYRRGTVNKLVVAYEGGGACWDFDTCILLPSVDKAINKRTVDPNVLPSDLGTGLLNLNDPANPFKDWSQVYVSYCTGDVHWGDNRKSYGNSAPTMFHNGRVNAKVAEKFVREHFLDPEQVYVTGISAGSYGAIFNSAFLMHDVYPQSDFVVVGDAGIGVITQQWLESSFPNWGVEKNLPRFIPALDVDPRTIASVDIYAEVAKFFPNARIGAYESAYDGSGGGQSAFYNVMKNPGAVENAGLWGQWWTETCEWSACMRKFVDDIETAAPANFRSFTAAGSAHGGGQKDNLYEITTGTGITYLDWINQALADDPTWASHDCLDGADCEPVAACQKGDNRGLACTTNADCPGGGTCLYDPFPDPPLPAGPYNADGATVTCPATECPCDTGSGGVACGD